MNPQLSNVSSINSKEATLNKAFIQSGSAQLSQLES